MIVTLRPAVRNVPRGNAKLVAWGYAVLWRRPAGFG
jgi:hypothetical protein